MDYYNTMSINSAEWPTSAASTTMQVIPTFVAVPAPPPEPEPEPETALDWLHAQVSEMCDLAFAA